jgi:hypothetical protein
VKTICSVSLDCFVLCTNYIVENRNLAEISQYLNNSININEDVLEINLTIFPEDSDDSDDDGSSGYIIHKNVVKLEVF